MWLKGLRGFNCYTLSHIHRFTASAQVDVAHRRSSCVFITHTSRFYKNAVYKGCTFLSTCTHSCASALGCGVYAPRGWWLWEVGPGYRLASGSLHCSQRGQLPLPSCGQGGLQQDTQGTQFKKGSCLTLYAAPDFFSNAWTTLLLSAHLFLFLGCGSQHCAFKRARAASAGVRKESPCLHPRKHQVRV